MASDAGGAACGVLGAEANAGRSGADLRTAAAFSKAYEELLNHLEDDEAVLFADAVYVAQNPEQAHAGWVPFASIEAKIPRLTCSPVYAAMHHFRTEPTDRTG